MKQIEKFFTAFATFSVGHCVGPIEFGGKRVIRLHKFSNPICIFVIAAKITWQSHYVRPVSGGMKLPLSDARAARVKSPVSVADEYASRR